MKIEFFTKLVFRSPAYPFGAAKGIDPVDDPFFSEAIYLASKTLFTELKKPNLSIKDSNKLANSIHKYKSRISSRCTPFGIFAGVGTADWSDESVVQLTKDITRQARLDMKVLCSIADYIECRPEMKEHLRYYPNSSIYRFYDEIRYVEYSKLRSRKKYQLNSINNNVFLEDILNYCKQGEYLKNVARRIATKKITSAEIMAYLNRLVDSQILVSEISANVSGKEYYSRLPELLSAVNKKANNPDLNRIINVFEDIKYKLDHLSDDGFENTKTYYAIEKKLKTLNIVDLPGSLFQVDMVLNSSTAILSSSIQEKLQKTIRYLCKIFKVVPNSNLENFKTAFQNRYENQMIPLFVALDSESGLGYPRSDRSGPTPLVDDLHHLDKVGNSLSSEIDTFLIEKLLHANSKKLYSIKLSYGEIEKLKRNDLLGLSDTFCVMFNVLDSKLNKVYFQFAGGSSGSAFIGRFGFADSNIGKLLSEIASFESQQYPEKILAEIIYLPEERVGNILSRPAFREYEIPYLAKSTLRQENQVELDDLFIFLQNDQFILWSKKLKKEIIPKLGNAHNYTNSTLPLYKFLCDLQFQNKRQSLSFNWGAISHNFTFLPRVEIEDVIVFPATWQLKKIHWQDLLSNEDLSCVDKLKNLASMYELPSCLLLTEGDNQLLLNISEEQDAKVLVDILAKRESVVFNENLFDKSDSLVSDDLGRSYANECIALVKLKKNTNEFKDLSPPCYRPKIRRHFTPGSEWVYYKIYSGVKTSDKIIVLHIFDALQKLHSKNLIKKWFFIRYNDPDYHIRLRLQLTSRDGMDEIIRDLGKKLDQLRRAGVIIKIALDSYSRELERYGSNNIVNSETIFFKDSKAVITFLKLIRGEGGKREEIRWRWAVANVNALLMDFKLSDEERCNLLKKIKSSYGHELGFENKFFKIQIDRICRDKKLEVRQIIEHKDKAFGKIEYTQIINERSNELYEPIVKIYKLHKSKKLQVNLHELIGSYIHMSLNRVFMGNSKLNEFVIYELIYRYYDSKIAMNKRN